MNEFLKFAIKEKYAHLGDKGLFKAFGPERVRDTPLSEALIAGTKAPEPTAGPAVTEVIWIFPLRAMLKPNP